MNTKTKMPNFTIVYNTTTNEGIGWIGTAWEFFNDKEIAEHRYAELQKLGYCGTLRPYCHDTDFQHLGMTHQYLFEQSDNKDMSIKKSFSSNKSWSPEKLALWKKKQDRTNALYRAASEHQLDEWVKGNSIHNEINTIISIVDKEGNAVSYYETTGGECCPDFSCCKGSGWPIEQRKKFIEFHKAGNKEACFAMLSSALTSLITDSGIDNVYVAGQSDHIKH